MGYNALQWGFQVYEVYGVRLWAGNGARLPRPPSTNIFEKPHIPA